MMMTSIQQFITNQGAMLQILFLGLAFAYSYNILVNLVHLFQILKGISRLNKFIKAYEQKKNCKLKQKALLSYFPIISRYLGYYSNTLDYGDSIYKIYYKCVPMRNTLLSKRDYQIHQLKDSFNPILGLKTFVTFPVTLLSWLGVRIRPSQGIAITIILGIIAYLFDMFKPEIKSSLISLFEYLVQTQKP